MNAPAVLLEGVSKRYAAHEVLRDVSLSLAPGECVALLGHNGAGKTTLVKLVLGLVRADRGRVEVLGRPVRAGDVSQHRATGFLPENVVFPPAMTGGQLLTFYARLKGEPRDRVLPMLERVGLGAAARQRVGTYSKGMRQRLGLAQALLGAPRLLLLDEPTSGLDPALRREFYAVVRDLQAEGVAVLICSHSLTEIESRAGRLAILQRGALVACGTLEELARAAGLPVQVRVSVTPGQAAAVADRLAGGARIEHVNERALALSCERSEKMPLLRALSGFGPVVEDVELAPPRLEEIYAHFSEREGV